jgi:hypothetical protein
MYKIMQLISNFFYKKKHVSLYLNTCSLDELDEKNIISKSQRLQILNQKVAREKTFLKSIW